MTPSAQNALLKTLEEPAPRTVLVLVTARPSVLLPTLRNRCQRIEVARPETALAVRWLAAAPGSAPPHRLLAVAGGSPLKALALAPNFAALEEQMTGLLEALLDDRIEVTRAAADMQGAGLPTRLDWRRSMARSSRPGPFPVDCAATDPMLAALAESLDISTGELARRATETVLSVRVSRFKRRA